MEIEPADLKVTIDMDKVVPKEVDLRIKEEIGNAIVSEKADAESLSDEEVSLFQLSIEEQEMLEERVTELENATPRSIRNFTIKYRLARSMVGLRLPEIDQESEKQTKGKSLTQMWDEEIEYKSMLAGYILESMNEKSQSPLEPQKEMVECLREAANTVSFYPLHKELEVE
jgi:hypothetical protein